MKCFVALCHPPAYQMGWARLPFEYGFRTDFDLKWVQTRAQIDFVDHRPGQLVNHIPNNSVITSKVFSLASARPRIATHPLTPPWLMSCFCTHGGAL